MRKIKIQKRACIGFFFLPDVTVMESMYISYGWNGFFICDSKKISWLALRILLADSSCYFSLLTSPLCFLHFCFFSSNFFPVHFLRCKIPCNIWTKVFHDVIRKMLNKKTTQWNSICVPMWYTVWLWRKEKWFSSLFILRVSKQWGREGVEKLQI